MRVNILELVRAAAFVGLVVFVALLVYLLPAPDPIADDALDRPAWTEPRSQTGMKPGAEKSAVVEPPGVFVLPSRWANEPLRK
jgi:hypothetical protein